MTTDRVPPRLVLDVALVVLAALVGAGLALERAELWDTSSTVVAVLILATALLAIVPAVLRAVAEVRGRRTAALRELHEDVLSGALWALADASGLDPRDLALAAYRVRRPRWRAATLERVHRVRARRRPGASGVAWAPGKGVIGECVASGAVVARDVAAAEGAGDPQGLSEAEIARVRGKYPVVVAVPLVDDSGSRSAVTGCLALDGPAGSLPALTRPDVLAVLEATARTLQRLTGAVAPAVASAAPGGARRLRAALERQGSPAERVAAVGGEPGSRGGRPPG
ncbi:hypothetical protein [Kineococcus sp. SYSU DK002]|uniref:hypothetical protein n=1 Tax=Kineococcus sp. SYSU DK002 TaxID=3383123 RepID=UPI003D7E2BA5